MYVEFCPTNYFVLFANGFDNDVRNDDVTMTRMMVPTS